MAISSKGNNFSLRRFSRKIFATYLREFTRTGRIIQILWDASQMERQEKRILMDLGRLALNLYREGKIDNPELEKAEHKIQRIQRIIKRQDMLLQSYQRHGDIKSVLQKDKEENSSHLAPV